MLHRSELHFNPDVYEQAKEKGLLNKTWFVFNSFTDELIGAYDSFEEAEKANMIE